MESITPSPADRAERMRDALWGLFVGDALAMPAHWFYDVANIQRVFGGGVSGYAAAPHPHPESFMVGMEYRPDVETARRFGRPFDILHEHARFYDTTYSDLETATNEREESHGNPVPQLEDRFHYHHGLNAGENTLGANLVRVLLRSVVQEGRYDPDAFQRAFVEYLAAPGANRDPYTEFYLRAWFENYSQGVEPRLCAPFQRDKWSVASMGGIVRPLVASLLAEGSCQGLGVAFEHQALTHRSENIASALVILTPLFHGLLKGADPARIVQTHSSHLRLPRITGEKLRETYRANGGPGNIPEDETWRLHTEMREDSFDIERFVAEHPTGGEASRALSTACYPEHGLPLLLWCARRHGFSPREALLANANLGGDSVHRGMVLGALLGATGNGIPQDLKEGLVARDELEKEIDAFVDLATGGRGL